MLLFGIKRGGRAGAADSLDALGSSKNAGSMTTMPHLLQRLQCSAVLADESPRANAAGALTWVRAKALWVEPALLGKRRSRGLKDERSIAAALAARAKAVVSCAGDLLAFEEPFGIPVMRPATFLAWKDARD